MNSDQRVEWHTAPQPPEYLQVQRNCAHQEHWIPYTSCSSRETSANMSGFNLHSGMVQLLAIELRSPPCPMPSSLLRAWRLLEDWHLMHSVMETLPSAGSNHIAAGSVTVAHPGQRDSWEWSVQTTKKGLGVIPMPKPEMMELCHCCAS